MKIVRLMLLAILVFGVAPSHTDGGIKPQNPNLNCGYRCTGGACVNDLLATATMYCFITWSPVGCEGGIDSNLCRPAGGG
jgi:hypothetical protein